MLLTTSLTRPFNLLLSLLLPIFQNSIAGIFVFVSSKIKSILEKPNCDEIEPNLYLGNAKAACDPRILRQLEITHILTVQDNPLPKNITMRRNITSLYIEAEDYPHQNLISFFPLTNAFINEAIEVGSVLVHCHYGISRSATIVIAYCMQKYNIGYEKALKYVRSRRPIVTPNPGFEDQLRDYYDINFQVNNYKRAFLKLQTKASKHKYTIALAAMLLACMFIMNVDIIV